VDDDDATPPRVPAAVVQGAGVAHVDHLAVRVVATIWEPRSEVNAGGSGHKNPG
jgi:hypothetical protein